MKLRVWFLLAVIVVTVFIFVSYTALMCFTHKTTNYYLSAIQNQLNMTDQRVEVLTYSQMRIVYNRVPKCGSRSISALFETMAEKHNFRVIDSAINSPFHFSPMDRGRIATLLKSFTPPLIYHRHFHFVDFEKYGIPQVAYINLIRDPVSRAVSHYYFRRFGDNKLNQSRSIGTVDNYTMTYDECVLQKHGECVGTWGTFFIIPFFCGYFDECRSPSREALLRAKQNVDKYLVVGILEEYDDFIKVLEKLLPDFFQGAYEQSKIPDPSQPMTELTVTRNKQKPSEKVVAISKENMKLEYEFYDFIKERFYILKTSLGIH